MSQAGLSRINKWDFMKLKRFCKAKGLVNSNTQIRKKKYFTNPTSHRGLVYKIYKALKKLKKKKKKNKQKMWCHIFYIHSSVKGQLSYFQLLAVINKATMNLVE